MTPDHLAADFVTAFDRRRARYAAASCAGQHELFDAAGEGEPRADVIARHRHAVAICDGCPILETCRADFTAAPLLGFVVAGEVRHRKRNPQPARRATA